MPNVHKWEDRKKPLDTTTPKSKGGAKSRHPNSLANLQAHSWKPGQSGNPSGKSTSINDVMRLARSRCCEAIEKLTEIMRDPNTDRKNVIAACLAIMDRGLGRPIVPVFKGSPNGFPSEMVSEVGADGEMTALLSAAGKGAGDAYKRALQSELDRLETEEREAKAKSLAETDAAILAMERGEDVDPALKILAVVRSETN